MRIILAILVILTTEVALAATSCVTRKSGSVVIETCTDSSRPGAFSSHCRSYWSGRVKKTYCR